MTDVGTSREAVERLIRHHEDMCIMSITPKDRAVHEDAAATLRAVLARAEAAEAKQQRQGMPRDR